MEQKVINKHFLVSVIANGKVVELLSGKDYLNLQCIVKSKYPQNEIEIMEYTDVQNLWVPDLKDHLLMVRRRTASVNLK